MLGSFMYTDQSSALSNVSRSIIRKLSMLSNHTFTTALLHGRRAVVIRQQFRRRGLCVCSCWCIESCKAIDNNSNWQSKDENTRKSTEHTNHLAHENLGMDIIAHWADCNEASPEMSNNDGLLHPPSYKRHIGVPSQFSWGHQSCLSLKSRPGFSMSG